MKIKTEPQLSELRPEMLQTNGKRANGRGLFTIQYSGTDIYDLLKLLHGGALGGPENSYLEVRKCVFLAEKTFKQAQRQGF